MLHLKPQKQNLNYIFNVLLCSFWEVISDCIGKNTILTKAAKYSVSVSFPPWLRITSVTAAKTAQICEAYQDIVKATSKLSDLDYVFISTAGTLASVGTNILNNFSVPSFNIFRFGHYARDTSLHWNNGLANISAKYLLRMREAPYNSYLFVCSWVGLPETLHLPESEVRAVRQATEEGAWGSLRQRLIGLLFHTGIFVIACTDLQWTSLQLIVKLESINCQITLPWEGKMRCVIT